MMVIKLYNYDGVCLELVFTLRAVFFFRLKVMNSSYNYRNPFKCLDLAIADLNRKIEAEKNNGM